MWRFRQYCTKRAAGTLHAARGLLLGTPQPPNPISVALGYQESSAFVIRCLCWFTKPLKSRAHVTFLSYWLFTPLVTGWGQLIQVSVHLQYWNASLWVVALSAIVHVALLPPVNTGTATFPAVKVQTRDTVVLIGHELDANHWDFWRIIPNNSPFSIVSLQYFEMCLRDKALQIVFAFSPLSFHFYFLFANVIPPAVQQDNMHNVTMWAQTNFFLP